jgi:hypothetical protein
VAERIWISSGGRILRVGKAEIRGWKSLDFLGFSRQNRAFSMGYTGISLEEISDALFRDKEGWHTNQQVWQGEAPNCSWRSA